MAVRPWENRFLDINLKDGVMLHENGSADGKNGTKSQIKSVGKKPVTSNIQSSLSSQKTGPSHSDGNSTSPGKSAAMVESLKTQLPKAKSKPHVEDQTEEGNSKPANSRSQSNPKERCTQTDKQAKKRLSLPNSGEFFSFASYYLLSWYVLYYLSIRYVIISFLIYSFRYVLVMS